MRRLAGHLFTFSSAVSLLICVAAGVAWFLSFRSEPWAAYSQRTAGPQTWDSRYVRIVSSKGAIWFADLQMLTPPKQVLPQGWQFRWDGKEISGGRVLAAVEGWLPSAQCHRALGIVICTTPFPVDAVPYWFIVGCGVSLPLLWMVRR